MSEFALLRVVAALLLVLGLVLVCGWLAKRAGLAGATSKGTSLRVSSRMSLGGRSSIVVLDVPDGRLVLGVTPSSINLLHTLPPGEEVPEGSAHLAGKSQGSPMTFQRIFEQLRSAKS